MSQTGNLARGELLAIYGSNFTSGMTADSLPRNGPLTVVGTQINIGGLSAPILYISPTQINVQVPFEIPVGVPSVDRDGHSRQPDERALSDGCGHFRTWVCSPYREGRTP